MLETLQDPVLGALMAEYDRKWDEINRFVSDPSQHRDGKVAEAYKDLEDELPRMQGRIAERRTELETLNRMQQRLGDHKRWSFEPQRTMPFSASQVGDRRYAPGELDRAGGQFKLAGFEDAGTATLEYSPQQKMYKMIDEAGPGTLGAKTWDTLKTLDYLKEWNEYLRRGTKFLDFQSKILQEGLDDQGGIFAPAELIARVIGRLPAPTALRGLVTTLTTGRDTLLLPRKQYSADDVYTTAFRLSWTGEVPYDGTGNIASVNDANLLGNIEIQVHTGMLTAPVTRNLIEDSAFPIQAWLEKELNETIDIVYEDSILNGSTLAATSQGNQTGQPIGILYGARTGNAEGNVYPEVLLSSTAAGIDYGSLVATQAALAPQYETDSLRWVMNKRSTWAALELMVDSNNRPLFTTGAPDYGMVVRRGRVLLGDTIVLSQLMPSLGSANFPIIFGDLKGYYIAQRVGFSIQVLDQTRAKANQIELVGRIRFGGRPVEPFRLKLLKSNNS